MEHFYAPQLNIYLYVYVCVCTYTYWGAHYVKNTLVHLTEFGAIYGLHKMGTDIIIHKYKIVSCCCY